MPLTFITRWTEFFKQNSKLFFWISIVLLLGFLVSYILLKSKIYFLIFGIPMGFSALIGLLYNQSKIVKLVSSFIFLFSIVYGFYIALCVYFLLSFYVR